MFYFFLILKRLFSFYELFVWLLKHNWKVKLHFKNPSNKQILDQTIILTDKLAYCSHEQCQLLPQTSKKSRLLNTCQFVKHRLQQNKGMSSRHKTKTDRLGRPDCPLSLLALFCAHYQGLLFRVFLQQPLTVLTKETRQAVCAIKLSI